MWDLEKGNRQKKIIQFDCLEVINCHGISIHIFRPSFLSFFANPVCALFSFTIKFIKKLHHKIAPNLPHSCITEP